MTVLPIHTLTREAFAPFGEVIMLDGAKHYPINAGTTERFHALARVDAAEQGGVPIISLFRGQPRPLPLPIIVMERHPLGSQAFVPLTQSAEDEYLVVVAPAGEFDASQMKAFLAKGFQGVSYARGVWHHPLIALHRVSDFLIVDRVGEGNNCDEIALDGAIQLTTAEITLSSLNFETFKQQWLAAGFDEVLERQWPANTVLDTHTHPFCVQAVVTQGEMWLSCNGHTQHLLPGATFELARDIPHAERYGAEGATYWVARKNG